MSGGAPQTRGDCPEKRCRVGRKPRGQASSRNCLGWSRRRCSLPLSGGRRVRWQPTPRLPLVAGVSPTLGYASPHQTARKHRRSGRSRRVKLRFNMQRTKIVHRWAFVDDARKLSRCDARRVSTYPRWGSDHFGRLGFDPQAAPQLGGPMAQIARDLGISTNTVAKVVASAGPPGYSRPPVETSSARSRRWSVGRSK